MNIEVHPRGGDRFLITISCTHAEGLRVADKLADLYMRKPNPQATWDAARFTTRAELRRIAEASK